MTNRIGNRVRKTLITAIGVTFATTAHAANENAQAFSDALDRAFANASSSGNFPPLASILSSSFDLSPAERDRLYASLTGDTYATHATAAIISDLGLLSTPLENLRDNLSESAGGAPLPPALWIRAATGRQKLDDDNNASQIRTNYDDSLIGGDLPIGADWRIGGALGFGQSDSKQNDRNAKADTDSKNYALFGGRDLPIAGNPLILQFGVSHSTHRLDSSRTTVTRFEDFQNSAKYDLTTTQLFGEAAYHIKFDKKGYVEPFFGLTRLNQRADSFTEKGTAISAASVSGQDNDILRSTIGTRARQLFNLGGRDLMLKGTLIWHHLQGDLQPEMTVQLDGFDAFDVEGTTLPKDTLTLQLKADYSITRQFILDIDYNGAVGSGLNAHEIALNAHWKM